VPNGNSYWQISTGFPYTINIPEAPHNGQVLLDLEAMVSGPAAVINPALTWDQSSDAGAYTCTMVMTFTAL
jgi:hypothetical protein